MKNTGLKAAFLAAAFSAASGGVCGVQAAGGGYVCKPDDSDIFTRYECLSDVANTPNWSEFKIYTNRVQLLEDRVVAEIGHRLGKMEFISVGFDELSDAGYLLVTPDGVGGEVTYLVPKAALKGDASDLTGVQERSLDRDQIKAVVESMVKERFERARLNAELKKSADKAKELDRIRVKLRPTLPQPGEFDGEQVDVDIQRF